MKEVRKEEQQGLYRREFEHDNCGIGAVVNIKGFCAAAGCLGSLGGWTLLAGQTAKAAADDGLFPPCLLYTSRCV